MIDLDLKKKVENLKRRYKSIKKDHLARDFYAPCLLASKKLKRATCDFTSSVLYQYGNALPKLVDIDNENCQIEILAEPKLAPEDIKALNDGLDKKNLDELYDKIQNRIIHDAIDIANGDQDKEKVFAVLAWLIKTKRLILKFAYVRHVSDANLFHDKEGIFYLDWDNKKIGFNGSENETYSGMRRNGGSFSVFKSWIPGQKEYVQDIEEAFDEAWNNQLDGLRVRSLNKKILEAIKSKAPENIKDFFKKNNFITKKNWKDHIKDLNQDNSKPFENALSDEIKEKLKHNFQDNTKKEDYLLVTEKKWEFQKKAREAFIEAKNGILEMATGTGKTRTALSIATQLINERKINKIILQMYGSDLIKQWQGNVNKWIFSKLDREVNMLTDNDEDIDFFLMNYKNDDVDFIIVRQSRLPNLLDNIKDYDQSKTLIIHDEVHDLFAAKISEKIIGKQNNFGYKLGLSATIREPYNKEREKLLFDEIQGGGEEPIYEYDIKKAIKNGILAELDLIYYKYELYDDEIAKIQAANSQHKTDLEEGMPRWQADEKRNYRISDVRKNARNKMEVFEEKLNEILPYLKRSFIFADETDYGDKLLNILVHKINVRTHYGDNDKNNLSRFSEKEIDCIINVMKLSQGVDVQSLNSIVLFATPKGRQFKQRLGRVLRTDPDNKEKRATVIDFFDKRQMDDERGSDYSRYLELLELSEIKRETNEH